MSNWKVKSDLRLMGSSKTNTNTEKADHENNEQPPFIVEFGQTFLNPAKIGLIRGFN